MKKILQLLFLTLCFVTTSIAQNKSTSAWQLFGGFSYMRGNVREYYKSTPAVYSIRNQYANLYGWDVSLTENVKSWFGGTLDASGNYGSPPLLGTTTRQQVHSFSYGPRFFHQGRTLRPFAHILVGVTHVSASVSSISAHVSATSFMAAPGGGLDMRLFSHGSIRLFQAEYFHTNLQGGSQNQLRASTGIVFDLNKK
jgi:hypothetical protein